MKIQSLLALFLLAAFVFIIFPLGAQQIQRVKKTSLTSLEFKVKQLEGRISKLEKLITQYQHIIKMNGPNVEIKASGNLFLKGLQINLQGQSIKIQGGGNMEISSSAALHIKGALIKLNQGKHPILTRGSIVVIKTPYGAFPTLIAHPQTVFAD